MSRREISGSSVFNSAKNTLFSPDGPINQRSDAVAEEDDKYPDQFGVGFGQIAAGGVHERDTDLFHKSCGRAMGRDYFFPQRHLGGSPFA